jgi:hypothetical protein
MILSFYCYLFFIERNDEIFVGTISHPAFEEMEISIEVNFPEKMWTLMDGEDQAEPMTVEYGTRNHCAVFDGTTRFEGSIQGNEYSGEVLFEGEGGGSFLLKRKYEKVSRVLKVTRKIF